MFAEQESEAEAWPVLEAALEAGALDGERLGDALLEALFATGRPVLEAERLAHVARLAEAHGLRVEHAGWRQVVAHLGARLPEQVEAGELATPLAALAARSLQEGRAAALRWGLGHMLARPLPLARLHALHDRLWEGGLLGPEEDAAFLASLGPPPPEDEVAAIGFAQRLHALLGLFRQRPLPYAAALVEGVTLPALLAAAGAGRVALALDLEVQLAQYWLRREESHTHYARWIGRWAPALAGCGRRRARAPAPPRAGASGRPKLAFLVHVASSLAHVQAMLTMLEACARLPERRFDYSVHFLHNRDEAVFARLQAAGVQVVAHELPAGALVPQVIEHLAARLRQEAPAGLVWLCLPVGLAYAFGRRLAPLQVWWSHKFHPPAAPDADLRLCSLGDTAPPRLAIEGEPWINLPASINPCLPPPDPAGRAALRAQFGAGLLLGTLARTEKMADSRFQAAVIAILRRLPGARWIYAGREDPPELRARLQAAGLEGRTAFIGWVDTARHAAVLDIHLDTFPLAGGLVAMQCAAQGVPSAFMTFPLEAPVSGVLDSFLHRARHVPGLPPEEKAARDALLRAPDGTDLAPPQDTVEAYVAWACRLGEDAGLRAAAGRAAAAYVGAYLSDHLRPARAFEAAISAALTTAGGTGRTA